MGMAGLQALIPRMQTLRVPGYSAAVINRYEVDWVWTHGVMEVGRPEPVTPHTRFQACSIAKPVTAVAVMRLVERGLLDLDEDVNRYMRSWQVPANGPWQPRITLRMLLSHTAGTTVHGFPGYPRREPAPAGALAVLNGLGNTRPVRVDTLPGAEFRYSGGGITIAQLILEEVTATEFPALMAELVFAPLGMVDSGYGAPPTAGAGGTAATGHRSNGEKLPQEYHYYPELAAGGLWTTPYDLALLAVDLMRSKAGKPYKLLRPETATAMMTRRPGAITGVGWFLPVPGVFAHEGDNEGFKADLSANYETGKGAVLVANGDSAWRLHPEVQQAIAVAYGWPGFAPEDQAAAPAPVPAPAPAPAVEPPIEQDEGRPGLGEYSLGTSAERLGQVTEHIPRTDSTTNETMTLAELMAEWRVPGCSMAVIAGGQLDWAEGFGVCDARAGGPVTPETIFQAGGLTRIVTAVVALRLAEQGLLDLDADVGGYLKSWRLRANDGGQPVVTVRQILTHTAGLATHEFAGYPAGEPLPTLQQVLDGEPPAISPPVQVVAMPGSHPRFAEAGFCLLQQVLEDVTGTPFAELAREHVFAPLGMTHSLIADGLPEELWGQAATGHWRYGEPLTGRWHRYPELAANGLWSTPADLARLVMALQDARAGRSNRLLSQAMATAMLTPQNEANYGLGVSLVRSGASFRFHQTFSTAGFSGYLVGYAEEGLGAVIMLNHEWGLRDELLTSLARTYHFPLSSRERALREKTLRVPGPPVAPAVLASYVGEYEARPDLRFRVTLQDGALWLEPSGQAPLALVPVTENRFFAAHLVVSVTFERDRHGRVTGLTLHQNRRDFPAQRQA